MDAKPVRRRLPLALGIALVVLVADQTTKFWAERTLTGREPIPVLGDFLQFRLLYNPGAAFSMGANATWVFTIIAAIAAGWLFWYLVRPHPLGLAIAFSLLLGGATTHLLDRLFRDPGFARGHVVDFIDYNGWFVGNVADIALTSGALLAIVLTALQKEPTEEPAGDTTGTTTETTTDDTTGEPAGTRD